MCIAFMIVDNKTEDDWIREFEGEIMKENYNDKMVGGDYNRKKVEEETTKEFTKTIQTDKKFIDKVMELRSVFGPNSKEEIKFVMDHVTKIGLVKKVEKKINTKVNF